MRLTTDWDLGIWTTPTQRLHVNGNVRANAFLYASDKTLKTDIIPYTDGKTVISNIWTKRYNWKDTWASDIWVIAQDVQKIFPEAVSEWSDGILSVDYAKLVVPLLQVTQEQEKTIEEQNKKIQNQEERLSYLEEIIKSLK